MGRRGVAGAAASAWRRLLGVRRLKSGLVLFDIAQSGREALPEHAVLRLQSIVLRLRPRGRAR